MTGTPHHLLRRPQRAATAPRRSRGGSQPSPNPSSSHLLISLKMLAVKRAETAGRSHLADAFDLRTLRALGVVLLEDFKQQLREETSLNATGLDKLALSRDPDADCSISGTSSDSEVFRRRSKDQPIKPSRVKRKRKQTHDGRHGEAVQRNKKRRKTSERR